MIRIFAAPWHRLKVAIAKIVTPACYWVETPLRNGFYLNDAKLDPAVLKSRATEVAKAIASDGVDYEGRDHV